MVMGRPTSEPDLSSSSDMEGECDREGKRQKDDVREVNDATLVEEDSGSGNGQCCLSHRKG